MSASPPATGSSPLGADTLQALDVVRAVPTKLDRWIDRLNPIFIKETRQAIKSKQFVFAFLLLLLVSWLISLIAIVSAQQALDFGDWGRDLFSCYFVVLAGAILIVVPFTAFRSLTLEREDATYEPLVMSTLSPREIIFGKLQSAMLQMFLYYSGVAPFMAFTALLQGFDFVHVLLLLGAGGLTALWCTAAALTVSSIVTRRSTQTLVSLLVLGGLLIAFANAWAWAFNTHRLSLNDLETQLAFLLWLVTGVASLVLLQQVAVINLTFPADNRSTTLRLIVQGLLLLIWLGLWVTLRMMPARPHNGEPYLLGLAFSAVLWSIAALFFVTEPDTLSRRVRRELPKLSILRFLSWPFQPGGQRGLVLVLLNVLVMLGVLGYAARRYGWTMTDQSLVLSLVTGLYLVIHINAAAAMSRWGQRTWPAFQALHARVATLVLIASTFAGPMVLVALSSNYADRFDFRWYFLISPVLTFEYLSYEMDRARTVVTALGVFALLCTAVNVPAMIRGLYDLWDDRALVEEHLA